MWESTKQRVILRVVLGAAVTVLLSAYTSYAEFTYLLFGANVTATVTKVSHVTAGSGMNGRPVQLVTATWADPDGTRRKDDLTVPEGVPLKEGGPVALRATPGEGGRARLAGRPNWVMLTVFAAAVVAFLGFGFWLYRESEEAYRPRPAKGAGKKR